MINILHVHLKKFLLLSGILLISSCAPKPITVGGMTAGYFNQPESKFKSSIDYEIAKGQETIFNFSEAISESLSKNHLLSNQSSSAKYRLLVKLGEQKVSINGEDIRAHSNVAYKLTELRTDVVLIDKNVETIVDRRLAPGPKASEQISRNTASVVGALALNYFLGTQVTAESQGLKFELHEKKALRQAHQSAIAENFNEFLRTLYEL